LNERSKIMEAFWRTCKNSLHHNLEIDGSHHMLDGPSNGAFFKFLA
jgi:hypothetical protein